MRVYNKIVLDIESGDVIESDSFEYEGGVAQLKGGGSQSSSKQSFLFPGMKPELQRAAEWGILAPLFGANFTVKNQGMGNAGSYSTTPNYNSMFDFINSMNQPIPNDKKKK